MSSNFPTHRRSRPQQKGADVRRGDRRSGSAADFAIGGLHGTSTEDIARRAGVSQPYVFRLFGTKKELFLETVRRGFRHVLEVFQEAAAANREGDFFLSMGHAYGDVRRDRATLMFQMQAYAACDDPAVRTVVREGFAQLSKFVERVSGVDGRAAPVLARGDAAQRDRVDGRRRLDALGPHPSGGLPA